MTSVTMPEHRGASSLLSHLGIASPPSPKAGSADRPSNVSRGRQAPSGGGRTGRTWCGGLAEAVSPETVRRDLQCSRGVPASALQTLSPRETVTPPRATLARRPTLATDPVDALQAGTARLRADDALRGLPTLACGLAVPFLRRSPHYAARPEPGAAAAACGLVVVGLPVRATRSRRCRVAAGRFRWRRAVVPVDDGTGRAGAPAHSRRTGWAARRRGAGRVADAPARRGGGERLAVFAAARRAWAARSTRRAYQCSPPASAP